MSKAITSVSNATVHVLKKGNISYFFKVLASNRVLCTIRYYHRSNDDGRRVCAGSSKTLTTSDARALYRERLQAGYHKTM